jgi:hypothetical protein
MAVNNLYLSAGVRDVQASEIGTYRGEKAGIPDLRAQARAGPIIRKVRVETPPEAWMDTDMASLLAARAPRIKRGGDWESFLFSGDLPI